MNVETQPALEPDDAAQAAALVILLANERAADIAETLNEESPAVVAAVLMGLPQDHAIEILDQPILDSGSEIVSLMRRETAAALLHGVSADRVADLCRKLEEPHRTELLDRLDPDTRVMIQRLLSYPSLSAGSIMTTEFASVPSNVTVQQTLDYLRKVERTRETVYAIYVLDPVTKNLVQAITLRRLITGESGAPVLSVARVARKIRVSPLIDREDVARLISKYDLLAVPVVDHGRVIGIVTVDDIMDAVVQETTEDLQKLGGMEALSEPYMEIRFWKMIRARGGWLAVLFLSEMLTASAMQSYQSELEKAIVLTLFIPLIMSSGGNSGSQATSLLIRSLALREITLKDWWRIASRELPAGLVLGAILGVMGVVRIGLWQRLGLFDYGTYWPLVALTVGLALTAIVTFGSMTGSMLPFVLKRFGFDPATASAPLVAPL